MKKHGSHLYDSGCRCERCVQMHNERVKRSRAARLAEGRLSHGTRSAYDAGCRCDDCRGARRRATERETAERRAARAAA